MTGPATAPFLDLQSYLQSLEERGRIHHVTAPVDPASEIACIARWALESTPARDSYAIVFDHPRNADFPVAVNLFYPLDLYAAALGAKPGDVLERWAHALANPIPAQRIDGVAAVHDTVTTDAVDLTALPVPVWTPGRDAGPYISAGAVITRDPDTGVQNVGTYRMQVQSEREVTLFFGSERQHGAIHLRKYRERDTPMPVAVVIGAAPAVSFAAAAKTAYGVDEMTIAGGLLGQPVPVVEGRTVPLFVPAASEIVIEGLIHPAATRREGPFGEALGYMEDGGEAPLLTVSAICHRARAVFHGYVQQVPPSDGHVVMEMSLLGPLWYYLAHQLRIPGIRSLALAPGSAGVTSLVVQLAGEETAAATVAKAVSRIRFGQKLIYLVDEDIDPRDLESLQWAVSSRVDPARDIEIIDRIETFQLDPSVLTRRAADGAEATGPPYRSSLAIIDARRKHGMTTAVPPAGLMKRALERWPELGLPPLRPRSRLVQLGGE